MHYRIVFDDNRVPKNWTEAFRMLSKNIEKQIVVLPPHGC